LLISFFILIFFIKNHTVFKDNHSSKKRNKEMCKEKNHSANNDHNTVQHYLDELSKIKLLDKYTLIQLHQNVNTNYYTNHQILNKISNKLIDDPEIN